MSTESESRGRGGGGLEDVEITGVGRKVCNQYPYLLLIPLIVT